MEKRLSVFESALFNVRIKKKCFSFNKSAYSTYRFSEFTILDSIHPLLAKNIRSAINTKNPT